MTIYLHRKEIVQLWRNQEIKQPLIDKFEQFHQLHSPSLGFGYEHCFHLRPGLRMMIYRRFPNQDIIQDCGHGQRRQLRTSFFLQGDVVSRIYHLTDWINENAGKYYLNYSPNFQKRELWQKGENILRLKIILDLPEFGNYFIHQNLALPLQNFFTKPKPNPFYLLGKITPEMQTAIYQVMNCSFQGLMKQLYLESKALELLSLQFVQFSETQQMSDQRLRQEQIEAIQEAQTILVNHLDCPPSLKTLAQQVNLNERQLKEGFRQLFGTSVFQYLYEQRMARSRQLLIETDMNVTEVAHHVGYRSIPSFSKAFRRKFGISPRHYQQKSPV